MTRLRWNALQHPGDAQLAAKVLRGTAIPRATIAALSLVLLSLGTLIAT